MLPHIICQDCQVATSGLEQLSMPRYNKRSDRMSAKANLSNPLRGGTHLERYNEAKALVAGRGGELGGPVACLPSDWDNSPLETGAQRDDGRTIFTCSYPGCGKQFFIRRDMWLHCSKAHKKEAPGWFDLRDADGRCWTQAPRGDTVARYACDACGREFMEQRSFSCHVGKCKKRREDDDGGDGDGSKGGHSNLSAP